MWILKGFRSSMTDNPQSHEGKAIFDNTVNRDTRIGVALDEAFNFYYADLFDVLHTEGAEYVPFSPVHDRLPEADGYIIGGGYPELFVKELEANHPMREALLEVSRNGLPVVRGVRRADVPH